jgi:excisionase family DNA binding protein
MPPILLDGRELADRLGVSYAEVMSWHRRGWIPSVKTGSGRVLFNLDRVVEALRDRQRKAVPQC